MPFVRTSFGSSIEPLRPPFPLWRMSRSRPPLPPSGGLPGAGIGAPGVPHVAAPRLSPPGLLFRVQLHQTRRRLIWPERVVAFASSTGRMLSGPPSATLPARGETRPPGAAQRRRPWLLGAHSGPVFSSALPHRHRGFPFFLIDPQHRPPVHASPVQQASPSHAGVRRPSPSASMAGGSSGISCFRLVPFSKAY